MAVVPITSKQQYDDLLASGKTLFIDFYADWCGPCRFISPEFEKLAAAYADQTDVGFYKVDIDNVNDLAQALQIRSIPTFHAYKNGQRLDKPVVGANQVELKALIQKGVGQV